MEDEIWKLVVGLVDAGRTEARKARYVLANNIIDKTRENKNFYDNMIGPFRLTVCSTS